jgi:D-alanyl-D-alanine carboxypeptidase/D-alanyl-D-alanine-endopeptidase (penicillin-binding protein 4)
LKYLLKFFVLPILLVVLGGCAASRDTRFKKKLTKALETGKFNDHFTGIFIYEPQLKDTLFKKNSGHYFTPASNTKIFTLYSSIQLVPDAVPVLKYSVQGDTLYMEGTGNPTTLHPYFKDSTGIHFIKNYDPIMYFPHSFRENHFAPGWAWEDYDGYYSAERTGFPLYGNVLHIEQTDSLIVHPQFFRDSLLREENNWNRILDNNLFYFEEDRIDTLEIPFKNSPKLTKDLLENLLGREIQLTDSLPVVQKKILYGIATDSVYRRMMLESDNFLAEQLLIMGSAMLSDTLKSSIAREFVLETYLSDLKHPPRWVDGSGLSRYNLFTPESMVHVLNKLYQDIPKERLFSFFPSGGETGTLEDWFAGNPEPYIFAKTGTLGNTYCLSGYMLTKSGKTLIFSFMNNHFKASSTVIKERMQPILEQLRDRY